MDVHAIEEILNDIFPRKISLQSPDDANEIIPELLAFWRFIQTKYEVDKSNKILNYLCEIEKSYFHIMNDSSKFGMAKSFMMQGSASGFDMTNTDEANQFMNIYNQNLIASTGSSLTDGGSNLPITTSSITKKAQLKKKKLRKMKKASRKKNK